MRRGLKIEHNDKYEHDVTRERIKTYGGMLRLKHRVRFE